MELAVFFTSVNSAFLQVWTKEWPGVSGVEVFEQLHTGTHLPVIIRNVLTVIHCKIKLLLS